MANLEGWLYRKKVTVTGSTDGAQTDYTIPITVHFGSGTDSGDDVYCSEHCATDFDDIRFTAADGETLLSHWLDEKTDSDNAVFWVKIPSIDASPATLDVYAYYGSASASSASSIADAFLLGDDFERYFNGGLIKYADDRLEIPCYTGSPAYQAVHPSVIDMGVSGWNGYRYWMAFTPYPNSYSAAENPSIVASNDKTTWVVPSGLTNPICPAPTAGFNADTELVYNDDTDELWIYWKVQYSSLYKICAAKSADGVVWTDLDGAALTASNPGTSVLGDLTTQELSPCIRKNGSAWQMWTGTFLAPESIANLVYRTSSDGRSWSTATTCSRSVSFPMWHFGIRYVDSISKYCCLTQERQAGGPIYYMESSDGVSWTVAVSPLLPVRIGNWDQWLYRPTFLVNTDGSVDIWYSGRSSAGVWGTGYVEIDLSDIRGTLTNDSGWSFTGVNPGATFRSSTEHPKRGLQCLQFSRPVGGGEVIAKKTAPLPHSFIYTVDFYDNGVSSNIGQIARIYSGTTRIGVGVWTGTSTTKYVYHNKAMSYTATSVGRSIGWHTLQIKLLSNSTAEISIDGSVVATLTSQYSNATDIGVDTIDSNNVVNPFWLDDVRVRKFTANEPAISAYAIEEYFPDDDTAPVLTSPTATATSPTTATANVSTDDGNGTLYFLASTNATESASTVKAALSQSVATAGAQSISLSAINPGTTYYVHFVQINGASLESASVVSTAAFTTDAIAVKGTTIILHAGTTPQASITDIVALWWDATTPSGAPDYSTTTASTNDSGVLTLDLDATTALSIGDSGFLLLYKLDATDHRDSLVFAGRVAVSDIS